ncbi:MAG TPA: GNAT family N-acetyltransferase [Candidatus Binatia bacterium]
MQDGLELAGSGFTLRSWRIDDASSLAVQADNRNIWSNLRGRFPRPYTEPVARTWISRCIGGHERGLQLAIEVEGLAVGGISVDVVTAKAPRIGEIGYWIGQPYWGRGIAGHAVRLVCAMVYEHLALDCLRATVRSSNEASLKILERSGFTVQSRMRRSDRRPGSAVVEIVYVRDRDESAPVLATTSI